MSVTELAQLLAQHTPPVWEGNGSDWWTCRCFAPLDRYQYVQDAHAAHLADIVCAAEESA